MSQKIINTIRGLHDDEKCRATPIERKEDISVTKISKEEKLTH